MMKNIKSVLVVFIILLASYSCKPKVVKETKIKKPNIVFLLADDLGYGDLGVYGQKVIQTPVMDKLANEGMRFTDFYAGAPVCSASRAVLLTGISSSRNPIRGNKGSFNRGYDRVSLRQKDVTMGEMLQGAGYQTAFVGKWHVEDPNDLNTWAHARGFEYASQEQWGSPYGGEKYTMYMQYINGMEDSIMYNIEDWQCEDEFRTKIAFDWLDTQRDKDRPFFLFMSYRAPHAHEYNINNDSLYSDRGWPEIERQHAAKITLLDTMIGRMLKKLEEMGELDNTLICLTSDNGPQSERGHDHHFFNSNGDLTGYKRDTYEGGIRVPALVYWKGKVKAGSVSDFMGSGQDFMPTLAEVAGVEAPKQCDGISMVPVLNGETPKKREYLNWEFYKIGTKSDFYRLAVRFGNMKAVRYGMEKPIEIYDLSKDIAEQNNLANQYPELVKRAEKIFKEEREESPNYPYGGFKK